MRKFAFTLTCLIVAISSTATGQNNGAKIVYQNCHPDIGTFTMLCTIRVIDGDSDVGIASGERPSWSPEGFRIAFSDSGDIGSGDIFVADLQLHSLVNLTQSPTANDSLPSWSPDGATIAFVSDGDGQQELYVMDATGANPTRITTDVGSLDTFVWSPDGRAIAFTAYADGVFDLYAMLAGGSNVVRLANNVGFQAAFSWSPDATRVLFNCAANVCAVNADGSALVQLTNDPMGAWSGVFSPDGGRLAYVRGGELVVMASDGTPVRVASNVGASKPLWSPDGRYLSFEGTTPIGYEGRCYPPGGGSNADYFCVPVYEIYLANADGTGFHAIATGSNPDWVMPEPCRPLATFTHKCNGAACTFDATGSSDPDGSLVAYEWQFGDGATATEPVTSHTFSPGGMYPVTLTVTDNAGKTGATREYVNANTPPVASFTVVCSGPACTFDGSTSADPDGLIVKYLWQFGDGELAWRNESQTTVTHTYPTGTFQAALHVFDNAGVTGLQTQTLTVVNALPVASFAVACVHYTCTYDASSSYDGDGTIQSFAWQFGDGRTRNDNGTGTYAYAAPGSYTITLTVTDNVRQTATSGQAVSISPQFVHIGDLEAAATPAQNQWLPVVSLVGHDSRHLAVVNAVVIGVWSDGFTSSCTTDGSGRCALSRPGLPRRITSVGLTITGVQHPMFTFAPADNHDSDGDSDGTTLTVSRP